MKTLLFVAAGGAIGASARYLVGVGSGRLLGYGFPWGTLTVNVLGCFIMGLLIEAMALRWSVSNELRAFLAVGILGGFTTFSAFSTDFALLFERDQYLAAGFYLAASVGLSIGALFLGLAIVRAL
ncbi:MAG: fluoride efflux transporter CrcB [Methyloceanibacter sp.]|uniref:fluoride efflux transporter CrcB n=1 Tax=Methyloceanibacter sp. TaxID=1965321 RepID=UPI003D9B272B